MSIQLQVVGLFYNVSLDIDTSGMTVQDLMDAAIKDPAGTSGSINGASAFNYGVHYDFPGASATMATMTATYDAPFTSRVEKNHYPAGIYSLTESFDPHQAKDKYSVWQYYLFDANGTFINNSSAAISFTEQSLNGVAKVTWRLVTILGAPTAGLDDLKSMGARNPVMRAVGV